MTPSPNPKWTSITSLVSKLASALVDLVRGLFGLSEENRDLWAARLSAGPAEREKPGKQRTEYEGNAQRNRALADGGGAGEDDASAAAPVATKPLS